MKISKNWKIVIGILTVLQLFVGLLLIILLFTAFLPAALSGDPEVIERTVIASLGGFLLCMVFLILVGLSLQVFYLIHAGTNPHITTTMKVVWIVLLLIFGGIVEVAYFFMEIVPHRSMTARIETGV